MHAGIFPLGRIRRTPAIHRHLMTAAGEAGSDLLDCGLEPPVRRGNPSRADHRDPKRRRWMINALDHQYAPFAVINVLAVRHTIMRSPVSDQFST